MPFSPFSEGIEDEGRRRVRVRTYGAAVIRLGHLTKSLPKSPHDKIPHPRPIARPRPGHTKDFYTMLIDESLQLLRGRLVSGSKM